MGKAPAGSRKEERCRRYQRRRPEATLVYQVVAREWRTLAAQVAHRSGGEAALPRYVRKEFEGFLRCGIIQHGFARIVCRGCRFEHLVAHSCKGRGLCSSCTARRMAAITAHLVEELLPVVPYRQWTLSFPRFLRVRLSSEPRLLARALWKFFRTVFAWQRRRAKGEGIDEPIAGGLALVQRFGSLLQLHPHGHCWIPDGVFYRRENGTLAFHRLGPPTERELVRLLAQVRQRVLRMCDIENTSVSDEQLVIAQISETTLSSERSISEEDTQPAPLTAIDYGFSLHAGLEVAANERRKLEKILGYGLRPAFARKRLSELPDGRIRLKLRKPYYDGRTAVTFTAEAFVRRLSVLIPPRWWHEIRYYGIFANRHRDRGDLKTLLPKPVVPLAAQPKNDEEVEPVPEKFKATWAQLLARTFGQQMFRCPRCGDRMRPVAMISDAKTIAKILTHLGIDPTPPPVAPARAPPQLHVDEGMINSHDDVPASDDVAIDDAA